MSVDIIKIKTQSQSLFEEFLDGSNLPLSSCDRVITDCNNGRYVSYTELVSSIQSRLTADKVTSKDGVTFVAFDYVDKRVETPILVRLLNLTHCKGKMFILVNLNELVYLPNGSKNYNTINELVEYVIAIKVKHLSYLKRQKLVKKIKTFFTFNKSYQGDH